MNESMTATGYVHVRYYEEGVLIREDVFKNRLTDYAVAASASLWVGGNIQTPDRIKLGTGAPTPPQTGPLTSDADLWTPDVTTERTCDTKTTFLTIYSEYGVSYDASEVNGTTYTEAGLYDAAGNMWAHAIITFSKTATQTASVLWKVQHVGN